MSIGKVQRLTLHFFLCQNIDKKITINMQDENSEKNIKKLFKNLTIRYIIQITRRKRAKVQ